MQQLASPACARYSPFCQCCSCSCASVPKSLRPRAMQSSALGLGSSNRITCSQVKAVRSQCYHGLVQRRCTSFLPALRQQFSTQQMLPFKQHAALATSLQPRHCSRSLTILLLCIYSFADQQQPHFWIVTHCCCFWHRVLRQPARMCGIIGIYKHKVGKYSLPCTESALLAHRSTHPAAHGSTLIVWSWSKTSSPCIYLNTLLACLNYT